jgi:hypothetical protein
VRLSEKSTGLALIINLILIIMTKENLSVLVLQSSEIKLTGISRRGCAITTINDVPRVLISRTTYARILNDHAYVIRGVIVTDQEPYNGQVWSRLHVLKM